MNVTIYSTPTCGYCHQAKKYLKERGVPYTEYDVSKDQVAAQEMVKLTGQMGVPVITIDGQVIIGFDRNKLDTLLLKSGNGKRPRLGLKVTDAWKQTAKTDTGPVKGALVVNVSRASLGEKAGLMHDDIITEVNSKSVQSAEDLEKALANLDFGKRLKIGYLRDQQSLEVEIDV